MSQGGQPVQLLRLPRFGNCVCYNLQYQDQCQPTLSEPTVLGTLETVVSRLLKQTGDQICQGVLP